MYKTMIASALFFGLLTIAYLQQKRNVPKKIVFLFAVRNLYRQDLEEAALS